MVDGTKVASMLVGGSDYISDRNPESDSGFRLTLTATCFHQNYFMVPRE
jgi:hypothetical protein